MHQDLKALEILLQRTSLTVTFDVFLKHLSLQYPHLGEITSYSPIMEGYEAANILLHTKSGKYVLKIFESNRQKENIDSIIQIHIEAPKVGVTVPEIIQSNDGFLSNYTDTTSTIFYCLTRYFEGENFERREPSLEDIIHVASLLAKINTLNFSVVEAYDSWSNKNLVQEYELNSAKLSIDDKNFLKPIVDEIIKIDMTSFSQAVIHGDMQRKHVVKNGQGTYCILDFGCMSNDYKIIDLSTYLAWFCLTQDAWQQRAEITKQVINTYTKIHSLNNDEIISIPSFIRASYAAYYLKTVKLLREGDSSKETKSWYDSSKKMLELVYGN